MKSDPLSKKLGWLSEEAAPPPKDNRALAGKRENCQNLPFLSSTVNDKYFAISCDETVLKEVERQDYQSPDL